MLLQVKGARVSTSSMKRPKFQIEIEKEGTVNELEFKVSWDSADNRKKRYRGKAFNGNKV
jgi:hypothetical protein